MKYAITLLFLLFTATAVAGQTSAPTPARTFTPTPFGAYKLADIRMRDVCILLDEKTGTYYAISSGRAAAKEGFRISAVRAFTSKDLLNWEGPHTIFQTPADLWGDVNITSIWAPEMHFYKGNITFF